MKPFVESLEFQEVSLRKSTIQKEYWIDFKIKGDHYILTILQNGKNYGPFIIEHLARNRSCSFCEENHFNHCSGLSRYKEDIYKKLSQHPNIRLKLLFL